MATRIYEIAKKYDKSSKDILALLKNHGFEYQSHMAVLGPEELTIIERAMRGVEKKTKKTEHTPAKKIKQEKDTFNDESPKQNVLYGQDQLKESQKKEPVITAVPEAKALEVIIRPMTVHQLSEVLHKPTSDILMTLLRWGIMSAKNEVLETDTIQRLAEQYGAIIIKPTTIEKEVILSKNVEQQDSSKLVERLPVIVVLGHVDHGKTTLLDFIRKTRVAEKEKGGITQHIGAYEVSTPKGNLIFIDTPGHEAFTKIRHRGSRVADLAILVIAGDDGMMPQTIEAIKHIKAAQIPVVVAVNKMDKADPSRLDIIKRQLAQQDLLPEDWGGQIVCVPISAKTGLGVDNLLEMVALQAQLLELRANAQAPGKAYVLESKIDKGRGAIATIIGYYGTIKVGDYFICGNVTGHITSLISSQGMLLTQVGPSIPVSVAGFDALAEVGESFNIISREEYRQARSRSQASTTTVQRTGHADSVNILIKTDTNSSREALLGSIEKIARTSPVGIHIVLSGVGQLNESDVELAYNTGAHIIVFNIKPESKAMLLAGQRGVSISQFSVIYSLLEYLTAYVESKRVQEMVSKKIGEAEILRVFDIKGVGTIAGCRITDGKFSKDGSVIVWREGYKIGSGKIVSLQREKRTVKEVSVGFECGFMAEGLTDFIAGDRVECFIQVPASH